MIVFALTVTALTAAGALDTIPAPEPTISPIMVETGYARDRLSGGQPDWDEVRLRASFASGEGRMVFSEGRLIRRFGTTDAEGRAGVALPVGLRSFLEVEASAGPGAVILPEWSLGGQIQTALGAGWALGGGVRHASYRDGGATIASALLERYFGDFRAAYRLSVGLLDGERAPGHLLAASWYHDAGSQLNVAVARGREIERSGPDALLVARASGASMWGVQRITDRVGVTFGAGFHHLDGLYDRTSAQAGLRVRLRP
jgi:YaiO family outer membrane protein